MIDTRIKELIAVGASVAANCLPCLQHHVSKARECGANDRELGIAIAVAKAVRKGAASKMDDLTAGLGAAAAAVDQGAGPSCGCGEPREQQCC